MKTAEGLSITAAWMPAQGELEFHKRIRDQAKAVRALLDEVDRFDAEHGRTADGGPTCYGARLRAMLANEDNWLPSIGAPT